MHEGKNMGIMTALKKPTAERGSGPVTHPALPERRAQWRRLREARWDAGARAQCQPAGGYEFGGPHRVPGLVTAREAGQPPHRPAQLGSPLSRLVSRAGG